MATYPRDRFDTIPDDLVRVGAHRAPPKRGHGWMTFAWAVLATAILVLGGMIGLAVLDSQVNFSLPFVSGSDTPSTTPSPSPSEAAPVLDPEVAITVLNGTTTRGLANRVGDELVAEGWAGVSTRANAAEDDVATTVVYYREPSDEGAARGIVRDLGVGTVSLSTAFDAPITVVIGGDYPSAG